MEPLSHAPENANAASLPRQAAEDILHKLQLLPPRYISEVEHFIDYLRHRSEQQQKTMTEGFFQLSSEVWDDE